MTALCRTYPDEVVARQAVEALMAAGVPGRDILLLTGSRRHDARRESAGSFFGIVDPDAPVGKYAGPPRPRWVGAGAFAGDPRMQRQGSFGDAERDVIEDREHGAGRVRTSGHRAVQRLLRRFALGAEVADEVLGDLDVGRAVVLAEVSEIRPGEAASRLDKLAPVA